MQTGFPIAWWFIKRGTVQTLQAHFFSSFWVQKPKKGSSVQLCHQLHTTKPFTLDLKAMFQINRYLQTGTQQLVIWNSLLAHRSPANSLEPIKTPKGTPRSPLISCFYYFPDTVYPFHPAPHPSLLYWSAAKPWISFSHKNHGAFGQDSSFHQLPNTKRPRTGFRPCLSASRKASWIIHLLPTRANKHTSDAISKRNSRETNCRVFFFSLYVIHILNRIKGKSVFMHRHYSDTVGKTRRQRFHQVKHLFCVYRRVLPFGNNHLNQKA